MRFLGDKSESLITLSPNRTEPNRAEPPRRSPPSSCVVEPGVAL